MATETKKDAPPDASGKTADGDTVGEGNREAARRYNEGLAGSVEKGNAEELAKKAEAALEGAEGDELRAAEERGKHAETTKK